MECEKLFSFVSAKRIVLTFLMNGLPALSSICSDSDLILKIATENPTAIGDIKQHCVFSLQHSISTSASTLNASFVA